MSRRKAGGGGKFSILAAAAVAPKLSRDGDTLGREEFSMEEVRRIGGGGFCDCTEPRRDKVPLLIVQ